MIKDINTYIYLGDSMNKIWLYITHCENSILEGDLIKSGLVERIFTTKSIFTKQHNLIEIIGE